MPEQYIEAISGYMWESGHYVWEPDADWDGDGVSNRDEYKAGTNTFSAEDYFRIKALEALAAVGAENFFQISFFAYPGRTYGVRSSETLEGGANWIYVPKSDASSGFYRVTVE